MAKCAIKDGKPFGDTLNRGPWLLPVLNGVYDMRKDTVRPLTPEDLFSLECPVRRYPLSPEQGEATIQVVLDIVKSAATLNNGKPLRHFVYFYGSGRNGKSLLLKLLVDMFCDNGFAITVSEKVVVKHQESTHNTYMEDACGGARLGFIWEMESTQKLNEKQLKGHTSGDTVILRPLYGKERSVKPTTIIAATNELPTMSGQQAILDRLLLVPFEHKFTLDEEKSEEVLGNVKLFFNYIMTHDSYKCKIDPSPRMKEAAGHYSSTQASTLRRAMHPLYTTPGPARGRSETSRGVAVRRRIG